MDQSPSAPVMLRTTVLLALTGLAAAAINMEVHEKYLTLPREEFIEYFNSQNYTFKIKHYEHLEGRQLTGAISTANISHVTKVKHDRSKYHNIPDDFDSRTTWSYCPSISEIYDQGQCGSCWAFGTGTVLSDRTCIHTGVPVRLSEQDYVCLQADVCAGGRVLDAFTFWVYYGFVTLDCLPYDAQALKDRRVTCDYTCTNGNINYYSDKHYGANFYGLEVDDYNFRTEIVLNGPVQASFDVYDDFASYSSGVYIHTYGKYLGKHSVRVLGFGNEGGIDYWLVANSWGPNWGDSGFFKIQRFQGGLGFESEIITGLPWN